MKNKNAFLTQVNLLKSLDLWIKNIQKVILIPLFEFKLRAIAINKYSINKQNAAINLIVLVLYFKIQLN